MAYPLPPGVSGKCLGCGKQITVGPEGACPECWVVDPLRPYNEIKAEHAQRKSVGSGEVTSGQVGFVAVMMILVLVVLVMDSGADSPSRPSSTELNAAVSFDGSQFTIVNRDFFDWRECTLDVNGGLVRSGFVLRQSRFAANSTHTVGALQFANGSGERFNPFTHKVLKIAITCDTPRGSAMYIGGPGGSRRP